MFVGDSDERFGGQIFTLDERGSFTCGGLPPGPVRLGLVRFIRNSPRSATQDPKIYELGRFEVSLEEPTKLKLDVPESVPDR